VDGSLVTGMDIASEKRIRGIFMGKYPGYSFPAGGLGFAGGGSGYMRVMDTFDGAANYSMKNPFFNVPLVLVKDSRPVLGVVYYPFQEGLFYALGGGGVYGELLSLPNGRKRLQCVVAS